VAAPSPGGTDWFEVDFGVARTIHEVDLYFLDDADGPAEATGDVASSGFPDPTGATGPTVRPPDSYEVQKWTGDAWARVEGQRRSPRKATGRRGNRVTFPKISTERVRVVLHHQNGATSGLTEIEVWGAGDLPLPPPSRPAQNLAWNPGDRDFPRILASFTGPTDDAARAVDGRLSFTYYSRNRWTSWGSPNVEDWLEVDLGRAHRLGSVELYLYGDGRGVAAPAAYRVETLKDGAWVVAPEADRNPEVPTAWALNRVELEPVEARQIRIVLTHDGAMRSGMTELRIFPPRSRTP
jgi:hypothetical protein